MKIQEDLEENEQSSIFPIQSYNEEGDRFHVELIHNKNGLNIFVQELKQFDYIILIHGEFDYLPSNLLERMNQFAPIQIVADIDLKKIKNKNLLQSYR